MKRTLILTISAAPFEVMHTGEKPYEFRKPSDWMRSRLYNKDGTEKDYDYVKFTNGYGAHRPTFTCEYNGFYITDITRPVEYSNGLVVEVEAGDIVIYLGKIVTDNIDVTVSNSSGLELTTSLKYVNPSIISNIKGGRKRPPNWTEYIYYLEENIRPHLILIRKVIEEKNWVGKSGEEIANYWNFFFNDGQVLGFSLNGWGDLMQSIVGKREGFRKYNKLNT